MNFIHKLRNMAEYLAWFLVLALALPCQGQTMHDDFSGKDAKRHKRKSTQYIVLHTTEAGDRSSFNDVRRRGSCNYLVTTNGIVHRIISEQKVAMHAGRSMWCKHSNLSSCSIGIEVVGHHNVLPTARQVQAIKNLLETLKSRYRLSDDKVVTHSMVAYGTPNRWHPYNHRGRKRCGMLFARPDVRKRLGLSNTFCTDPDVDAGRLKNADPYLAHFLYCGRSVKVPSSKRVSANENESSDDETFEGFRIITKKLTAKMIAGSEYDSEHTIYFLRNGKIRTGAQISDKELCSLASGTKVLVGYTYGGKILANRSAYSVVGSDWDEPSTFYRFPNGTIRSGDDVEESDLLVGTIVLFRD